MIYHLMQVLWALLCMAYAFYAALGGRNIASPLGEHTLYPFKVTPAAEVSKRLQI